MHRTLTAGITGAALVVALVSPALADPIYTPHPAGNPPTQTRRQLGGPPVDTAGPIDPLAVDPKHRPLIWRHDPATPALPNHLADPPVCVQPSDTGCQNQVTGRWVPVHRAVRVHHRARSTRAIQRAGRSGFHRVHRRSTPARLAVHRRTVRHHRPRNHCRPTVHHRRHRYVRLRVLWVANRHAYAWLHAYKHHGWLALGFKTIGLHTRLTVLHR